MLFHGAYFSNYIEWLRDPLRVRPTSHFIWPIVGQEILNLDVGGYYQGISTSSGLFQAWYAQGMISYTSLKCASLAALTTSIAFFATSFFAVHVWPTSSTSSLASYRSTFLVTGLGSISWSGHLIHIANPIHTALQAGVEPSLLLSPQSLLSRGLIRSISPGFGTSLVPTATSNIAAPYQFVYSAFNSCTGGTGATSLMTSATPYRL